ncbi:MAG: HU family DNA-binding protein [Tannerella sp.]|jgi:nucleoid DNA-binding protein|nr:HU family DNA-binding protein [Tannerella sp.]
MNERFTTRNLAEILAAQTGLNKERAEKFIDVLSAYIAKGIEKNKFVKVIGLGTFKIVLVRERESVHIHTGERFVIPAHHKITYIPDKDLKDQINRPFAFFEPVEASEDLLSLIKPADENAAGKDVESDMDYDAAESEVVYGMLEPESAGEMLEPEPDRDDMNAGEPVIVDGNDEKLFGIISEDTEHIYPDENPEYDYFSGITEEEEVFDSEPAVIRRTAAAGIEMETEMEEETEEDIYISELPAETEDKPLDEFADNADIYEYEYEYGRTNTYRREDEDTVYTNPEFNGRAAYGEITNGSSLQNEQKKAGVNVAPLWLWFLLLPVLILAGVSIATYTFLYFNANASSENGSLPVNGIQTVTAGLNDAASTAPLPIGEVRISDTDDSVTGTEDDAGTGQVNGENIAAADSAGNKDATKKEEKRVIDWFSQTPEPANPQQEQAGNKTAASANTPAGTGQSNKNKPTTAAVTNKPSSTPAAPVEKTIPARVRMTAGSSLTQLAMEHYGDKVFWVYIYEHNKSRIKDFNNIPVGMEIYLPRPNTYGINAKNKASVQKARQKQSELLNWDDYR